MPDRLRLANAPARNVDLSRADRATGATITSMGTGLAIVTAPANGAFAAAIPLPPDPDAGPRTVWVEIDGLVSEGTADLIFATPDMRRSIGATITLSPGHARPFRTKVGSFDQAHWLLVRNGSVDGQSSSLTLNEVRLRSMEAETLPRVADLAAGRLGRVDIAGLAAAADAVENPAVTLAAPTPIEIDAVPVELLGQRLGFANAFDPALASRKPLTEWRMEDDDQQIFRYLYREAKPHRHLEFGTWQGAGTLYCLEESAATVWTINLLDGERLATGNSAYGDASDSQMNIGRFYLEAGQGHRVCQIFSDSQKWDIGNYPPSFFDSVLIDGGHQADVVESDTAKAIVLLRSGGLCLWHDFAPDPAVFGVSSATIGVAQGIRAAWPVISAAMRDVFYIWPSQILVGIRR